MKNKFVKTIALCLTVFVFITCLYGCGEKNNETYDNYSYGLTSDGFYENLEQYPCTIKDFSTITIASESVLEYGLEYLNSSGDAGIKNIDDYIYRYGEEFLLNAGLIDKDVAEIGDIVTASLEFYIDDKKLDGFESTKSYKIEKENDEIVGSFVGRKINDSYDVNYTFPEDDQEYASKVANVKVKIDRIVLDNPLEKNVVESNLDKIEQYFDGVVDKNTFLEALRPVLVEATISLYLSNYMQEDLTVMVPEEYVEYEVYRFKARLQRLGYTYDQYLKDAAVSDEDVKNYCTLIARENYICMLLFKSMGLELTQKDIEQKYGDNQAYIAEVQGEPYMKLNTIRDIVIEKISQQITLTYKDEVIEGQQSADENANTNDVELDAENSANNAELDN